MRRPWLLLPPLLLGCDGGGEDSGAPDASVQTFEISDHRFPCVGEAVRLCMQINGSYFYDEISGFSFQWGTASTATVSITPIDDPPADGSSARYELIEVVETQVASPGDTFDWSLDTSLAQSGYIPYLDMETMTLLDGHPFTCADANICDTLSDAIDAGEIVSLTFAFGDPVDGALEIIAAER
ncbi:MAG: DUF4377 domain-containing protein [Myxococcota bacterium]